MDQLAYLSQRNGKNPFPVWIVMLVDILLVNAGFALAFLLRFGGYGPDENKRAFLALLPYVSLITPVIFTGIGLYTVKRTAYSHVSRLVAVGVALILIGAMSLAFWQRQFAFPRSVFAIAPLFHLAALNLWRSLALRLERKWYGKKKLLIVGTDEDVKRLLSKVYLLPSGWVEVAGIHPPGNKAEIRNALPKVDAVLLTEKVSYSVRRDILNSCAEAGCEIYIIPDLYEVLLRRSVTGKIDDIPIIEIPGISISPLYMFFKRCFDVAFALLGLFVSLPAFLLIGLLAKVVFAGPVFYSQERVGLNGKNFRIYKFRTMILDAEKLSGPVLSTENDLRVTPLGRILRSTHLDELPQLVNVLRGDMSLVGPRPERPEFVRQFLGEVYGYRYRYLVRPGLTGLAQVRSKYSTRVQDKLRYDIDYIVNYSLLLDLKILLETIPVVFSKEPAVNTNETLSDDLYHYFASKSKAMKL